MCQKHILCDNRKNHRGKCNKKLALTRQVLLIECVDDDPADLEDFASGPEVQGSFFSQTRLLPDNSAVVEAPVGSPKVLKDLQLPFTWSVTDASAWEQMLSSLMPHPQGRWPKSTCTRLVQDVVAQRSKVSSGPFKGNTIRHATTLDEVHALLPHIKWSSLSSCLDPMSGTNTISSVLQSSPDARHVRVYSNDWDDAVPADSHDDALQPRTWVRWASRWTADAVVTSPYFAFLDLLVPLMLLFVPVLIVHVPSTWLFSATPQRRRWLQEQYTAGRLHIVSNLPRGAPGPWRCCWAIFTQSSELLQAVVVRPAGICF